MPFTTAKRSPGYSTASPEIIAWNTPCHFCGEPVGSAYPLLIMSLNQAAWIGVSHVECGYNDFRYAQFRLRSPGRLNTAQVSFLTHFYPCLFKLPGWGQPVSALRRCLALILLDFPEAWSNPAPLLQRFIDENRNEIDLYQGDLQAEFFNFLGEVQKAAQKDPIHFEIDFDN